MKHLLLLIGILFLICAVYAETPINEGAVVYPTETSIALPTTEPIYVYNGSSTNEISTDDKSGHLKVKPINDKGEVLDEVDIKSLSIKDKTVASVELENTTHVKEEKLIIQIKPNSKLVISSDGKKVKQTKQNGKPLIELYYGYQKSASTPWEQYSRVDSCDVTQCKVVYANFTARKVWIETRSLAEVMGRVNSDIIPEFNGVLP